jgi:hypothetical protein
VSLGIKNDPQWAEEALELGEGEPDDNDKAIAQANRENNMMLHGVWKGQTARDAQDRGERGRFPEACCCCARQGLA